MLDLITQGLGVGIGVVVAPFAIALAILLLYGLLVLAFMVFQIPVTLFDKVMEKRIGRGE